MSASDWDFPLASAAGLLTNEERSMLLDVDFFDDDLLKNFPHGATKEEPAVRDDSLSLYPSSPASPPETKPTRAELAGDLLYQIENECKQENIFPNWLEEKVDLPFEGIPLVERAEPAPAPYVPLTEELLREFDDVYGAVELTHLTPPQSPPGPATQLLLSYAQHAQCVPLASAAPAAPAPEPWHLPAAVTPHHQPPPQPQPQPQPLFDSELQTVEELVRASAALLPSPQPADASPATSPPSSPRSSTDDEWSAPRTRKPYARSPDDRRSRKKEQNKNAATRYRQKKKAEIDLLLGEESALRQRHAGLADKCADLQREIRYLKGLMRDLFKAKGLIK